MATIRADKDTPFAYRCHTAMAYSISSSWSQCFKGASKTRVKPTRTYRQQQYITHAS